jgi:TolA-binding protein
VTGDALSQDVEQLRRDVNALRVASNRNRGEAEAVAQLDRRSREQASDAARQIAALSSKLDGLSSELTRIGTRIDDLSRRVDAVSRQAAAPPAPSVPSPSIAMTPTTPAPAVPAPPATPVPGPAAPPATGPRPSPPIARPTIPPPARPSGDERSQEESYQAAYLDLSRGRYDLAIAGFRDFLRRFPASPLADSAQYGIGEAYYSQARAAGAEGQTEATRNALEHAVQEFRKVLVIYPRGAKVPTALYKEALALAELKQTALAQTRLQYLVDHFPQSEEAPLAKERLAALRQ